jgi:hypothetical protein
VPGLKYIKIDHKVSYRIPSCFATTNPNSGKTLAPTASEILRKSHNNNPLLNRTVQVNSLPVALGLGALAYPHAPQD